MAVTVVGRWQTFVGAEDRAIAAAVKELSARGMGPPARRSAQLFQSIDEITSFLYVSEWADRAAFDQYRISAAAGSLEAEIRDHGEFLICERRLFFGNFAYRAQVTACAIYEAPPEAGEALFKILVPNGRWVLHGSSGLVSYAVHREVSHTQRLVIVHDWQTEAALAAARGRHHELLAALATVGGTVARFTGVERASTDIR